MNEDAHDRLFDDEHDQSERTRLEGYDGFAVRASKEKYNAVMGGRQLPAWPEDSDRWEGLAGGQPGRFLNGNHSAYLASRDSNAHQYTCAH